MRKVLFIGIVCLIQMTCKARLQTSDLKHSLNSPTSAVPKWNWIDYKNLTYVEPPELPIANLPLALRRLQGWVDMIDQQLREKFPGELDGIPKPKIQIFKSPKFNANHVGATSCFSNVEIVSTLGKTKERPYTFLYMKPLYLNWDLDKSKPLKCNITQTMNLDDLQKLVLAVNSRFTFDDTDCQLSGPVKTEPYFRVHATGKDCGQSGNLAVRVSTNLINIPTQLLTLEKEMYVLAVLFHETAHHYKAHASTWVSLNQKYRIIYRIPEDTNTDEEPTHIGDGDSVITEIIKSQKFAENRNAQIYAGTMIKVLNLEKKLNEMHLARFSKEEEADELASERMYMLGYDPKSLADFVGDILVKEVDQDSKCPYSSSTKVNVAELSGNVEFGSFSNTHPSSCFRTFSILREIAMLDKKYGTKTLSTTTEDPEDLWKQIRESAKNL